MINILNKKYYICSKNYLFIQFKKNKTKNRIIIIYIYNPLSVFIFYIEE